LPYLAAAVARFLQEYPWTRDGLSRTERRLLELAAGGTVQLSAAFPRMHAGEEVYYVTDMSLATLADGLSRTSPPLLTLARRPAADGELHQGRATLSDTVTLTDIGQSVLAGRQDRIATCGIERWRSVCAVELEVRPPGAPTTEWLSGVCKQTEGWETRVSKRAQA
jgi:hypothetical protein